MATDAQKKYYAIKNSLSATEKELINYYELQWVLRQYVPTVEEVIEHINTKYEREGKHHRTNYTSVNYYLGRSKVQKALDDRGIPWRQHSQEDLTATQIAAAVTMMNFADSRSNDEKLDQLGINPTQYYAWLNDPQFKNLIETLKDQNLRNIDATAIGELTKKIHAGDWQAVKYYLDTTGALQGNEAPQSEHLLRVFIEIIQRHVKDEATIIAIALDLKAASANRTLEVVDPRKAITGEVVDDEELAAAKRKLGVA